LLFPLQGQWTEEDYLALDSNRMIELVDGCLEVLPMPTLSHQFIVRFLFRLLDAFVCTRKLGQVAFAPCPIHLGPRNYREPDLFFLRSDRSVNRKGQPVGMDLGLEVVSPGTENRQRDLEDKRAAYARAGVTEYWIVDPQEATITVLTLDVAAYREHGVFRPGSQATSVLLPGFAVDVAAVFAAGQEAP